MNTTPPQAPPSPPRTPWRFVRRERGRMLAGVATGMADAFHIDVVVIRVIWVVAAIATGGIGVIAYAICWLAFPSDQHPAPLSEIRLRRDHHRHNAGFIAGLALLALGFVIVFSQATPPLRHGGSIAWATVLIGGGLAVLFLRRPDRGNDEPEPTPSVAPTETREVPGDVTAASEAPTDEIPPGPPGDLPPPPTSAWTQAAPWPEPPRPRVRRLRRRPFLTPLTISLLLIGAGVASLLDAGGAVHLTVAGVLASALIVVGGALVISTWFGRAHGLIPIGLLLLLATIPAVTIDVPISGGIGDRQFHPTTRASLQRRYELGIGRLVVDLRNAPLSERATSISGSVGIGELDVDVPANVRVDVRAHAGAGATEIFGRLEDGWPQNTRRVTGSHQTGVVHLDLRVGAGSIHVRRWSSDGALELSQN